MKEQLDELKAQLSCCEAVRKSKESEQLPHDKLEAPRNLLEIVNLGILIVATSEKLGGLCQFVIFK